MMSKRRTVTGSYSTYRWTQEIAKLRKDGFKKIIGAYTRNTRRNLLELNRNLWNIYNESKTRLKKDEESQEGTLENIV